MGLRSFLTTNFTNHTNCSAADCQLNKEKRYINPYIDFGFKKLFEQAEIARFTPQDVREYEESVKIYRDLTNVVNTAERKGREKGLAEGREEGLAEGRAEGREEVRLNTARKMKADVMPLDLIAKYTGLTIEVIETL